MHENDEGKGGCPFAAFFESTPQELPDDGIFSDIAIALHTPPHREVTHYNTPNLGPTSDRGFTLGPRSEEPRRVPSLGPRRPPRSEAALRSEELRRASSEQP